MNELDLARAIATGAAPSPSPSASHLLWALRVSGTGRAERTRQGAVETAWRDPATWLSDETKARVGGLPILLSHPPGYRLTSDEFADRCVGNILFPYVANRQGFQNDSDPNAFGPDLWAVARIYDDATNELLQTQPMSTSPSASFRMGDGETTVQTATGHVLIEATPAHLCHCALVMNGIWDKGDGPSGIGNDFLKEKTMADEKETTEGGENPATVEKLTEGAKTFPGEALDKLLSHIDDLGKRLDAMSEEMTADKQRRADAEADRIEREKDRVAADSVTRSRAYAERLAAEDEERSGMGIIHQRADSIFMGLGQRAVGPMSGETRLAYRVRLARSMQRYSKDFGKIDLNQLKAQPDAFTAVEDKIYADADAAARAPDSFIIPGGGLREVTRVDPGSGQRITSFYGDTTFIGLMKRPSRRLIGINTKAVAL